MRAGGLQFRIRSGVSAVLLVLSAHIALSACAAPSSYAGIPLSPGAADEDLQQLARRAQAGDKHAQLELGIRYEEGRGVPRDIRKAKRLYTIAAADSGGTIHVYMPPVGKNGQGRIVPVSDGPVRRGLLQAKIRREALQ